MLAPLENVTDNALRELLHNHGADLTFTEMAMLNGIMKRNKKSLQRITIQNNVPTQIQLAVLKETELIDFLKTFQPTKSFKGFNLNLGCPAPNIIKQGMGCGMIKRISKIQRMVKIIKDAGYPCSIKMRLGLNLYEKKKKAYLNLIKGVDADFFIVHVRHGSEHYDAPPDYEALKECVETGKNIIANGDIDTIEKVNLVKAMGVKGVMIGRVAVKNPFIFEHLKGLKETSMADLRKEYLKIFRKYKQESLYQENFLKRFDKQKLNLIKEDVMG